jgi:prepilin-type N-terminal cleavage/methylation domain-containing protein
MHTARGFSLVEMVLALALTLIVSAGVFAVVRPAQEAAVAQPEIADMQQRLRIAADAIFTDLVLAGTPAAGGNTQPLGAAIPTILPFRPGPVQPDAPGTFRADTLTVVYAPAGTARTTIAQPLSPASPSVPVNAPAGCPMSGAVRDPACGFTAGAAVLVFDATGAYDHFSVAGVTGNALVLTHSGGGLSHTYPAGSSILRATRITYYLKPATMQLMRYNGAASDAPAVDNVAGLEFEYFGVQAAGSGLVHLAAAELSDGPWRPNAVDPNRYDADLLRIRRVTVRLHLKAAAHVPNVPDLHVSFDVSPRSLGGITP